MKFLRKLLISAVDLFFKIYFSIVGRPELDDNLKKALKLYSGGGFVESFNLIRAWDAPFAEIEKIVPRSGRIIDLGCGDGILGNYLALASKKRKVLGIELNEKRIKEASRGVGNAKFIKGNIIKKKYASADSILLVHVLHHLKSFSDQEVMLEKCIDGLKKGGKIIIVEIIEKPILKFLFSAITDMLIVPILFEGKLLDTTIHYRSIKDWKKLFAKYNLSIKHKVIHEGMPFSHVIFTIQGAK